MLIGEKELVADALEKAFLQKRPILRLPWRKKGCLEPVGPVRVELASGEVLWGSLAGATESGIRLFGWYQIDPKDNTGLVARLQKEIGSGDLSAVLETARKFDLELEPLRKISFKDWRSDATQETNEPDRVLANSELKRHPAIEKKYSELATFPIRIKPKAPVSGKAASTKAPSHIEEKAFA